jgi:hypothetical protein
VSQLQLKQRRAMSAMAQMQELPLVTYTLFPNVWPKTKTERIDTPWEVLVQNIQNAPTYIDKAHCPLISIGEYGDLLSNGEHPILRHAANIKRIFGIEIDYDGEQMPIEEAAALLQGANVCSVLYTSPSHTPQRPRWRVLMPLSDPTMPEKREEYVARANRILGGVATRESFTLSQSFYIGRVRGAEYVVIETAGRLIDLAYDIDPLYYVGGVNDGTSAKDATTDEELRDCFTRGAGRYTAMLKLSSRWAARGMPADDIETTLLELLGSGPMNADGIDLRTRCRPLALSAVAKYGETRAARTALEISAPTPAAQETPVADEPPVIEAKVFEWIGPKEIPPRPWLYSHHYMRGMVSATAGIGGAGKSTLLNVELISMAIGKDLLRDGQPIPVGPLTVWGHNGEDPYQELQRRILAICQHYGVTKEDLGGRLRITSGRDMPIMVARELTEGGKILVPTEHGKQIGAEILKHGIQVFVADPFVTIHRVNENDNVQIDGVLTILRDLAHSTSSAVEVAHHFRKLNGDEANVDAIRGASSLAGACRSVRIVSAMNKEDAAKYGIDDEQRGFYSWLQNAKANNLPPTHKRHWIFMASVDLDNAQPPYESDKIGVATSWVPPDTGIELTAPEFRMIRGAIQQADPLKALRSDVRASGWIGNLLATVLERDSENKAVKSEMVQIIAHLERGKHIKQQPVRDPRQARMVTCYLWIGGANEE